MLKFYSLKLCFLNFKFLFLILCALWKLNTFLNCLYFKIIHYNKLLRCKEIKKSKSTKLSLSYPKTCGFNSRTIKMNHLECTPCQLMQDQKNSKSWSTNLSIKILKLEKDKISTFSIKLRKLKINSMYFSNKFNIKTFKQILKSFTIQFLILK